MFKKQTSSIVDISIMLIMFFILFYILYIGSSLIIPFIVALLFSFAIIWLSNFYKRFKIWEFLAFTLSLFTYIFIFWLIWKMIGSNIEDLVRLMPEYQFKVSAIITQVFESINIPEPTSISAVLNKVDLAYVFNSLIWGITSIFSSAGIILFYVMFILLEYRYFKDKLNLMVGNHSRWKEIFDLIEKIKSDIKSYFVIKTVVSFITWALSYIIMQSFGLDFALFWAFLIFALNYIPSIWSIIAVTFPALLSLIQFDSYYTFVFMTSFLVGIQTLMWNIIEQKFVWNKLNLSPLVIIISLWFWGAIWWVVWMLLSVPIMVMINIVFAKIPSTRPIAILLSEKWELQIEGDVEVVKTRKKLVDKVKGKFKRK